MEFSLTKGKTALAEMLVGQSDTASSYGSGLIDVFATPAMIAFMEKTAMLSIQSELPAGYITLGTEICVTHVKATAMGKRVTCETELMEINGKKLLFKVRAFDEAGLIGEGTHRRYIVNAEEFVNRLSQA